MKVQAIDLMTGESVWVDVPGGPPEPPEPERYSQDKPEWVRNWKPPIHECHQTQNPPPTRMRPVEKPTTPPEPAPVVQQPEQPHPTLSMVVMAIGVFVGYVIVASLVEWIR